MLGLTLAGWYALERRHRSDELPAALEPLTTQEDSLDCDDWLSRVEAITDWDAILAELTQPRLEPLAEL
jgi:hypothetical protein